jgi:hypothetical protein
VLAPCFAFQSNSPLYARIKTPRPLISICRCRIPFAAPARLGYSPHLFEDRLHLALADRAVEGSVIPLILVGISH